jgi:hypothetical protein
MPLFYISSHQFKVGDVVQRGRWVTPFGPICVAVLAMGDTLANLKA